LDEIVKNIYRLSFLPLMLAISACTILEDKKIDYQSAKPITSLEIPPDLNQIAPNKQYAIPGLGISTTSFNPSKNNSQPVAMNSMTNMRIDRFGNHRWLVVDIPPEKLWQPVVEFWQENGFTIEINQPELGIMETNLAENRAKIPMDGIRKFLGKALDRLYSSSERDKYRTRFERNKNGGTDIFLTHRGMEEVYDSKEKQSTIWQPRGADPELEAEFLRRLLIKLGASPEKSVEVVQKSLQTIQSRLTFNKGDYQLSLPDAFDRAWRVVGLSLDRTGFTVVDRDRSKGFYFVRYAPGIKNDSKEGFLSGIFSTKKESRPLIYTVQLKDLKKNTTVTVLDPSGITDKSKVAQEIISLIAADLK